MEKRKHFLVFVLIVLCVCFTACQMENPIMEAWWQEQEAAAVAERGQQEIFQGIEVITIQYAIFAGGQTEFNNRYPGPGSSTELQDEQVKFNTAIIANAALMLRNNPDFRIILHGNANPIDFTAEEIDELTQISLARAESTAIALSNEFRRIGGSAANLMGRLRTVGFGGGLTVGDPLHPDLNRRVEVILFKITTQRN